MNFLFLNLSLFVLGSCKYDDDSINHLCEVLLTRFFLMTHHSFSHQANTQHRLTKTSVWQSVISKQQRYKSIKSHLQLTDTRDLKFTEISCFYLFLTFLLKGNKDVALATRGQRFTGSGVNIFSSPGHFLPVTSCWACTGVVFFCLTCFMSHSVSQALR